MFQVNYRAFIFPLGRAWSCKIDSCTHPAQNIRLMNRRCQTFKIHQSSEGHPDAFKKLVGVSELPKTP